MINAMVASATLAGFREPEEDSTGIQEGEQGSALRIVFPQHMVGGGEEIVHE